MRCLGPLLHLQLLVFDVELARAWVCARSSAVYRRRDSYWVCTRYNALTSTASNSTRLSRIMPRTSLRVRVATRMTALRERGLPAPPPPRA
jgi:hypothetical protein